jgi:hypothetical protein
VALTRLTYKPATWLNFEKQAWVIFPKRQTIRFALPQKLAIFQVRRTSQLDNMT